MNCKNSISFERNNIDYLLEFYPSGAEVVDGHKGRIRV
jgi:hypothetical protein